MTTHTSSRLLRKVRAARLVAAAFIAAPLLAGCAGTSHSASTAIPLSVATDGPGAGSTASGTARSATVTTPVASSSGSDQRPQLRLDSTEADMERYGQGYNLCLGAHGVPLQHVD